MAYNRILSWPAAVAATGLTVIVEPDFATTGHTAKEGWPNFEPEYIFWHHDASRVGPSPEILGWLKSPARPAQMWVCDGAHDSVHGTHPKGTWHFVTSGLCWHAGLGGPYGSMPKDQANPRSAGIETDHTTGEPWSTEPELLASLRVGTAAILKHEAWNADRMLFHKTWAPTRKVDPDGLDLAAERIILSELIKPIPPTGEPPVTPAEQQQLAQVIWDRFAIPGEGNMAQVIKDIRADQVKANADIAAIKSKVGL